VHQIEWLFGMFIMNWSVGSVGNKNLPTRSNSWRPYLWPRSKEIGAKRYWYSSTSKFLWVSDAKTFRTVYEV